MSSPRCPAERGGALWALRAPLGNEEEKDARGKCIHKERYTGTCNRRFYVGEDVTQEDIKAAFKDGVLTLQIPQEVQKQEEQPKLITIE